MDVEERRPGQCVDIVDIRERRGDPGAKGSARFLDRIDKGDYERAPMELDASCLRWAKVENLERLARALRASLPMNKRHNREAYHRALVRVILRALDDQERDRRYGSGKQSIFSIGP